MLPSLPKSRLSLNGLDPALVKAFQESTKATPVPGRPGQFDYSDILAKEIAAHDAAYNKGGAK
jgi:hypothetical protein